MISRYDSSYSYPILDYRLINRISDNLKFYIKCFYCFYFVKEYSVKILQLQFSA